METLSVMERVLEKGLQALLWGVRPLLAIAVWYVADYFVKRVLNRTTCIECLFTRHLKTESHRAAIERRVGTFKGLFVQSVRFLNAVFFLFIFLDELRIDIKPLLAGIGVVGLGLSLAAQNVLRDFINGLFILIEDQFNVGDFVDIGAYSGTVESFTMRATRLRASNGNQIVIPNGTISAVVNETKNYSIAVVDVGVAYDTDIRHALAVLEGCAERLAEENPSTVLGKPSVLGIMKFGDSDVQLRVNAKTRPGEQWAAARALRLIIKERFDAEGIEIPFPQMDLHMSGNVNMEGAAAARSPLAVPGEVEIEGDHEPLEEEHGAETE